MQNEELEKLIEQEVEQKRHCLRFATRLDLPEEEIEKQLDFYLDKILQLRQKMS